MAEADARRVLSIYSIAAHRGFADALVAGLLPRYAEGDVGLARLTLLLPSRRAVRTITEAFVRLSGDAARGEERGGGGLLLPRMAVIGDIDLDETLGPLLDPLGAGAAIPPAADPARRWLRLGELLRGELGASAPAAAPLLRQAREIARTMDRLLVEGVAPEDLLSERVLDVLAELSGHWRDNLRIFARVQQFWLAELATRGEVDAPTRRNLLFEHAAASWRADPPRHPIVAAGVTSASPAIARLLRIVAELPNGAVVLPDLDLSLDEEVWRALGRAGIGETAADPPLGRGDALTHPQYHLKLLLNRMGVARGEVRAWHRAGLAAAPPERSRAISNLFLPAEASARWVDLPADRRRLSGVRLMETAHPEEEAQAIAIRIREALAIPERRVALVTPDRGLASRVIAHLERWGIAADDTAGRPLPQTAAGRMLLVLAEVMAERAAPIPLLAALSHPLVAAGDDRAAWLEKARALDLALRGPRLDAGLEPVAAVVRGLAERSPSRDYLGWWQTAMAALDPLVALGGREEVALDEAIDALATAGEALCGTRLWAEADGRMLAVVVEDLRTAARAIGTKVAPREIAAILRDAIDTEAVRPPYGGHPRLAIYGLIEARMSRADLVICGALHEGSWPAHASADALIAPPVLRALGVPGGDFRIGLAAHDLAAALGAPKVVLSYPRRDSAGPVIASRFVLRVRAMLGSLLGDHWEERAVALARGIDDAPPAPPYPRPQPMPSAEQRKVALSATGLDRLRGDPYQFYAQQILRLKPLEAIDEEPTPAFRGTAVHAILERWATDHDCAPGRLLPLAEAMLHDLSGHPFMRGLWQPRLLCALEWIEKETQELRGEGRLIAAVECAGAIEVDGVRVTARADRIDRNSDGALAIVDYKTGQPPTARSVEQGFALQLGIAGLVAQAGGFDGVEGEPTRFEYWSLARSRERKDGFGYRQEPVMSGNRRTGIPRADFLPETERYLREAIARWINGNEPFTARLNPDLPSYTDYDQLMRLDEWQGRVRLDGGAA